MDRAPGSRHASTVPVRCDHAVLRATSLALASDLCRHDLFFALQRRSGFYLTRLPALAETLTDIRDERVGDENAVVLVHRAEGTVRLAIAARRIRAGRTTELPTLPRTVTPLEEDVDVGVVGVRAGARTFTAPRWARPCEHERGFSLSRCKERARARRNLLPGARRRCGTGVGGVQGSIAPDRSGSAKPRPRAPRAAALPRGHPSSDALYLPASAPSSASRSSESPSLRPHGSPAR